MPIYEYKCEQGHVFEVLQKMADDPLTTCEECGAPVQRLLHPPAVHFKGSGFYNTDYGTKRRAREKAAADAAAKSESKSSSSDSDSSKSSSSDASKSTTETAKPSGGDAKPAKSADKPAKAAGSAKS